MNVVVLQGLFGFLFQVICDRGPDTDDAGTVVVTGILKFVDFPIESWRHALGKPVDFAFL